MDYAVETSAMRKVALRIVPFSFFLFILNYIDRVNVSFAALQMNEELGFTPLVYGIGSGVFFIGYVLFEVPSNLVLHRVGARLWIARIMITWGILSACMALVVGSKSFYVLRFLVGAAEAGFFPGMVIYFGLWFPQRYRAKALAYFLTATVIALVIGAPLSGFLMTRLDGVAGLAGWKWMFLLEGVPAFLAGVAVPFCFTGRPEQAAWLTVDERSWLAHTLAKEEQVRLSGKDYSLKETFTNYNVIMLTLVYFFAVTAIYGVILWLPQIIKSIGSLTTFEIGIVTAIPFLCAAVAMVLLGRRSDRTGERRGLVMIALGVGGAGLLASAYAPSPVLALALLCVAAMGMWGMLGVFWSLPTAFLSGRAAAAGVAFISAVATTGGFIGPFLVGWVRDATGSFQISLAMLAASALISSALCAALRPEKAQSPAPTVTSEQQL